MAERGGGLEYNPYMGSTNRYFSQSLEHLKKPTNGVGPTKGNELMLKGDQIDVPKSNSLFGSEGFGMNQGTLKGLGTITDMATGIGGLYLGAQQLSLAKDKFEYDKKMMDKQYAMAKDSYDKQVARANSVGSQMNAGKV